MRQLVAKALTSLGYRRVVVGLLCANLLMSLPGCGGLPSISNHQALIHDRRPMLHLLTFWIFGIETESLLQSLANVWMSCCLKCISICCTRLVYLSVLSAILICSLTYFGRTSAFWWSLAMKNGNGKMMLHINISPWGWCLLNHLTGCAWSI